PGPEPGAQSSVRAAPYGYSLGVSLGRGAAPRRPLSAIVVAVAARTAFRMTEPTELRPVRVWDLPTRVFHWLLAAAVIAQVITGKIGGNALVWHVRIGLTVGALLVF